MIGSSAARASRTPLGDPGRLTISVRPRVPLTPRDSAARGNDVRLSTRSRSAIPGASRSSTAWVASGVTSRALGHEPPRRQLVAARRQPAYDRFTGGVFPLAPRAGIGDGENGYAHGLTGGSPACRRASSPPSPARASREYRSRASCLPSPPPPAG